MNEMIELTKKLGIIKNIIFIGALSHEELSEYYATADLFILPSFSEGFGLVIIEAMSSGTLVAVSDLPAIHDIVKEGETGFFFDEISATAISRKIKYIMLNLHNFDDVKCRGREYVVKNFDWEIVKNNYLKQGL